jgi:hypothetical protein
VGKGTTWRAMPTDLPPWDRPAFSRRRRDHGLVNEFHDQMRGQVRYKLSSAPAPRTSTTANHAAAQVLPEQVAAAHHRLALVRADGGRASAVRTRWQSTGSTDQAGPSRHAGSCTSASPPRC